MLLSRDYVGYMATELAKRLLANNMIETATPQAALAERIRVKMAEEIAVEDRLNEEVRDILNTHADEMRRTGRPSSRSSSSARARASSSSHFVATTRRGLAESSGEKASSSPATTT